MAHYRKHLAAAVALNSGIFVVEAAAGYLAGSLSLIIDSIHNFSDELALVALCLAFILSQGVSLHLLRIANVFNSVDSSRQRLALMASSRAAADTSGSSPGHRCYHNRPLGCCRKLGCGSTPHQARSE